MIRPKNIKAAGVFRSFICAAMLLLVLLPRVLIAGVAEVAAPAEEGGLVNKASVVVTALFLLPLMTFVYITRVKRRENLLFLLAPAAFLISMEIYWGRMTKNFSPEGALISSFIIVLFYTAFYRVIKRPVILSFQAFIAIAGGLVYYIGFDVYYSFFKDYPSIVMLSHSSQASEVTDSFAYLVNGEHFIAAVIGAIYLLVIIWNIKAGRDEREGE